MKVFGFATDSQADWTAPFTIGNGFKLRLMGGDSIRPLNGNWLQPPYPTSYIHGFQRKCILPFFSFRLGKLHGYIGWKIFGVDQQAYRYWMPLDWVYQGSFALCPSATLRWHY